MNPAFGFQELLIIMVIAIVVVGPKDLPLMVRRIGKFVGQIRATARDFQRSFDELGREAELAELRKEIDDLKNANPVNEIERELRETETEMMRVAHDRPHPRTVKPHLDSKTPHIHTDDSANVSEDSKEQVADADLRKTGEG